MADYQIPLSYVVNVSVLPSSRGLQPLQLGTILILTDDEPVNELSGDYVLSRTATGITNEFGTESATAEIVNAIFSQNPNILNAGGYVVVAPYQDEETTAEAITRLSQQIYTQGILTTRELPSSEAIAASELVESMPNNVLFLTDTSIDTFAQGGLFNALQNNDNTRKLLYLTGETPDEIKSNARKFAAAFASRGLSVNYAASNSAITMTYKDLTGVPVDTNISETILSQCEQYGADVYCSIEGLPKVISFKQGGLYFDELTNQIWLRTSVQTAVANVLFTTRTKIPQTTQGVNTLVNAVNGILNQGVINGVIAAGEWNSPDTFGVYEDFMRSIRTQGYYTYYVPLAEQSQEDREARKCPLINIAVKQAGAIEHANIIIYVEA
jgi:hypothetical protein